MNPDSTPTSDATKNTAQPKAISVLRITLATLFIVACAVAGFDYQAKVKWQKAVKVANKLFDEGNDDPKKYMDQIGSSPRATVSGGELTQIYRWTGGLRTYDLRLKFHGAKGIYVLSELLPITQFTFKTSDISKMERAKATGTLDDKSTEDSFVMTIQDGADGFGTGGRPDGGAGGRPDGGAGGRPGGGAGGRPGGGAGGRPGGGAGGGFRGFNGSDLNMDKDTQAKWDSAVKKISEYMTDLPEDRRVAFTKRRELQQKFREEAKGYLSEEQYAIFEKNNPVRQSRGRGGINAEQLGLEGDVKTKYEAATEKLNEQRRALFAGGGERSREGLLEKMMAMRDKHKAELKTILSADQFKKYQGIESQQRQRRGGFRRPGGGGSRPQSPKGSNPKATKSGTKDN